MPLNETGYGYLDPMNLRACYAESKRMAENMCVAWSHQHGVPVKIVRPFHTYGPGMRLDDGRVFADFVSDIVHRRDITLTSDGSAKRVFCYLADATAGFFTVLLKGRDREAYNIGNDREEVSILHLAQTLAGLFPERGISVRHGSAAGGAYMPSPVSRSCPDISKARALGWEPRYSIRDGFERTIRSYE
jgi:nucleoside-diphosphate-sugar epimerase